MEEPDYSVVCRVAEFPGGWGVSDFLRSRNITGYLRRTELERGETAFVIQPPANGQIAVYSTIIDDDGSLLPARNSLNMPAGIPGQTLVFRVKKASKTNFTNATNFPNIRRRMNDVQHFDTPLGNPVYNQMRIKDDVSVHATFGCKMATFGVVCIETVKRV
jgi:hypothetical protein